ncbi:MAG TPA: ComF family protein [Pyrinomonadaceae bacterium]|nr:ComF family protein [Pyrinomonadaceae bacterium]
MLKAVTNAIISIAFPQQCHVCANSVNDIDDGVACNNCWSQTRIFSDNESLCGKCGALLSSTVSKPIAQCHRCDDHLYDRAAAVGVYESALAKSVLELKKTPSVPKRLHNLLGDAFDRSQFTTVDLIVPVPLSAKRRVERGFNQAELIANVLVKETGIPSDLHSLTRKIHTPMHRAAMDRKARELTVKNAFEIKRPKLIAGRSVLLVDDIFTSGATASYCAKALKKSGAAKVNVLTLARAN